MRPAKFILPLSLLCVLQYFFTKSSVPVKPSSRPIKRRATSNSEEQNASSSTLLEEEKKSSTTPSQSEISPSSSKGDGEQELRDVSLVFMGDSITRYQYLSLAYFFRWGRWFDPRMQEPHLVCERSYNSPFHKENWLEFYWQTNRFMAPHESCDCFRPVGSIGRRLHQVCENRYYYDPDRNISVTYIQAFSNYSPQQGHLNATTALQSPGTRPPHELTPYTWKYHTWHDTVRNHIANLKPKPRFAVVNAGAWGNSFMKEESNHAGLARAFEDTGIHGIWKTTTSMRNGQIKPDVAAVDSLMCDVLQGCLNLTWTKKLSKDMWWDQGHFLEPVYRRMNEQMLEMMGYTHGVSEASSLS